MVFLFLVFIMQGFKVLPPKSGIADIIHYHDGFFQIKNRHSAAAECLAGFVVRRL